MDTQVIALIIAFIATIPGILAFFAQMRKDKLEANSTSGQLQVSARKTEMDINKAAQEAALAIIVPLREEVARLHKQVGDLNDEVDRLNLEIEKKELRIAELESILQKFYKMEIELKEKDGRIVELESMLKEKNSQIALMQEEIENLQTRVAKVEHNRPTVPRPSAPPK